MKDIREIALTQYYPYGKNKTKIIAERTEQVDKAISEHDAEIRADERQKFTECLIKVTKESASSIREVEAYKKGKADTKADIAKECKYLLACGMGKKKSLEHLIKILEKDCPLTAEYKKGVKK